MRRVKPGETVLLTLPWSEVCMHLRLAGKQRRVVIVDEDCAQILNEDGTRFSFPITLGEAGVYRDAIGLYIQELPD